MLAEPNLTAVSGQTASFLAGGEFPYEVAQPGSVGNTAIFTVEFKQFGVQLAFTPTIIDANHLSLRVRPEVSQLDFANGVPLNGSIVPALTVRRAETTLELASGQSFALAGLLMHNTEPGHFQGPMARRHSDPRRIVPLEQVPEQRDANSSSSSRPTWSAQLLRGPLRRPTDLRRRTMRSKSCLATLGGVGCRRQRAARLMLAGVV